jgi:hypothetical protein
VLQVQSPATTGEATINCAKLRTPTVYLSLSLSLCLSSLSTFSDTIENSKSEGLFVRISEFEILREESVEQ